jgi:carbonic anhydrase
VERFASGNKTFREGFFQEHTDLFLGLLQGQHPVALYVGCADSRVPIELIAGALPGDLYVVRNTGGIVPPSYYADACVGAAIEHAVEVLQVAHAIVCGHYGCGAIAALVESAAGSPRFVPHLSAWLAYARPALERVPAGTEDAGVRLRRLAEENVRLQLANLRTYSCVQAAEQAGRLRLHAWIYDWDGGLLLEDRDGALQPL